MQMNPEYFHTQKNCQERIMSYIQLSNLVNMYSPEAVFKEIRFTLNLISSEFDTSEIAKVFKTTIDLYEGNYPGYRVCSTEYHDLRHVTDVSLAMVRLIHGALLDGRSISERHITISLIAALLHDAGYIQEDWDMEGTGAKHTAEHVPRSADFLERYGIKNGLSDKEIAMGRSMILCTDLALDISAISFFSDEAEFLGKLLCAADLLAQMADRTYLEKLLFLYHEFKECNLGGYKSAEDLLQKTIGFYAFVAQRIEDILDGYDRLMILHFSSRWDIHRNLYHEAIENQKSYLNQILANPDAAPFEHLRRNGIVRKALDKYTEKLKVKSEKLKVFS